MIDLDVGQYLPNVKESSILQPPNGSEADVIAQTLFPLARSTMEHVENACHPMAEAIHIVDSIKSQLYSINMLVKQTKLVVEAAAAGPNKVRPGALPL